MQVDIIFFVSIAIICITCYQRLILYNANFIGNALPSFKWISNGEFDQRIQIGFPDGGPDDVAMLKPSIPSFSSDIVDGKDTYCIFHGQLRDDSAISVYVSGCPGSNSFQVIRQF